MTQRAEPRRVAVVGASGFIGRVLVRRLMDEGWRVRAVDRSHGPDGVTEAVRCDLSDAEGLGRAFTGVETVYNLAGARGTTETREDVFVAANVGGAHAVCRAASDANVRRVVFVSTAAVYGREDGPDESAACHPTGPYGRTKLEAERVYETWAKEKAGRHLVTVRPSVVFGPGDDGYGNRMLAWVGRPDFVLPGPGDVRKSLAYVENLAAFLVHCAGLEGVQLFNYCDAPDLSLKSIASQVRSVLGMPEPSVRGRLGAYLQAGFARASSDDPVIRRGVAALRSALRERRFDATRAHSMFQQPLSLSEGIAVTAEADLSFLALMGRPRG